MDKIACRRGKPIQLGRSKLNINLPYHLIERYRFVGKIEYSLGKKHKFALSKRQSCCPARAGVVCRDETRRAM